MAEAAISSAVELLADLLVQKVKSLRGVEGKVQSLKEELEWMQSFLKDANKKQAEDEGVRNWIRKIREVAQDAEDTIEMFLINVENAKNRGFVKRCTGFPKRMYHLNRIGDEIGSILVRLDAIDKSRERYGIRELGEVADSTSRLQVESRRRLPPWQKDEHLVGVEDDVNKLLRESVLNEAKKGLSVAVIEGMGGIGKSSLAREVYNHPNVVVGRFDCRSWVVVSSEFTPQETIKQLILQLSRSDEEKENLLDEIQKLDESMKDKLYLHQKLQEMLHKQLQGRTYFIVLDDVWEQEHWEYLKSAFPIEQDKTSRLLLTTRNKIVMKNDQYVHKMKLLDPGKSWELFLKKAFTDSSNGTCHEDLESIGRQILEKCDGLPLAISVVGGLLMDTQDKSRWLEVLDQINSYSNTPENKVPHILDILELSYQNLSPQLKSCFLCLAFFEEDFTIPAQTLVHIWVGLGLIQQEGSRTSDEIARGHLNELINRSMLQIHDQTIDGRVRNCRHHDLLREVCLSKAKEEMGVKIVKGEEGGVSSESSCKPRHRIVYSKNPETFPSNQDKRLRSLFLSNVNGDSFHVGIRIPSRYWKSFQLLKILYLDGFVFPTLPDPFRSLLGLKYLRIHTARSSVYLKLPSWFGCFKKLEVFYVEYVEFSDVALEMERLRHFRTHRVRGTPMKIENWKSIETLKGIRLKDWVEISTRLMANSHLRELGIRLKWREGDDVVSRAKPALEKMTNLVELRIDSMLFFAHSAVKLIPNLDSLTVLKVKVGFMFERLAASRFPPNLSRLTLAGLIGDPIEELGKLPRLQYLTLKPSILNIMGRRMKILHNGFPCLKALSLKGLIGLRGIDIEEGGMPRLKQLRIRSCPDLRTQNLPKHIIISST